MHQAASDRVAMREQLPVLVLAWDTDPTHLLATAEQLAELISGARLEIAHTLAQVGAWGELSVDFLS
jgi:3-oxoadipate enol-lactonase